MSNRPAITAIAPWFGSNRTLAHEVGRALSGCRWVGVPFAGGMPEVLAIKSPTIVVGDLHRHVINLANVMADECLGPKLQRRLSRIPCHPDILHASQQWCKERDDRPDTDCRDLEAAYHYFVACWMGRSGKSGTDDEFNGGIAVRWNANGGDSNTRYRSAVKSIVAWRQVLRRCTFVVMDAFEFLAKVQDEPEHAVYCDPPFPGPGAKYRHKFTEQDHRRLADSLCRFTRARVVVRYYDHRLIRELYPAVQWEWHTFKGRKQSNADAPEVLLVNRRSEWLF